MLEQIAQEYGPKGFAAYQVDVDKFPDLAMRFGAMSLPTLLLFKGGRPVEQWVGYISKSKLSAKIQAHVA